jgi:PPP family 3-phenylpropionic acid transporter
MHLSRFAINTSDSAPKSSTSCVARPYWKTNGRFADLFHALRGVFSGFAVAAALTAFGYLPAHAFWSVLAVSVIYAAMLAPLTTNADALALGAVGASVGDDRRFEYGWVRGAGSAEPQA